MDSKQTIKLGIFLLLIAVTLTLVGTLTSYALPETNKGSISVTKKDTFFINYDNTSPVKNGGKAQTSNTITYQMGYTNVENEPVNETITIHLSKGLTYVKGTSSLGEPTVKKDNNGSILVYKRTMLSNQTETGSFSCLVNKEAKENVEAYMTLEENGYKKDTPKLINPVGDFTITYKSDGNGTVSLETENVKYKGSPSGSLVTPNDGFKFLGWTSSEEITLLEGTKIGANTLISNDKVTKINVTNDITLTANFESKDKKYVVTYEDDGEELIEPFKVEKGTPHKLMNLPEKEGFQGKYWTVDGVNYLEGRTITIDKDTVITANYEKINNNTNKAYKVVYKTEDKVLQEETVPSETEIQLKDIKLSDDCTIKNYKINDEEYRSGETIVITSNLEVYASSQCAVKSKTKVSKENTNINPVTSASINVNDSRFSSLEESNNIYRLILYVIIGIVAIIDFYLFVGIIKKHKKL